MRRASGSKRLRGAARGKGEKESEIKRKKKETREDGLSVR